VINIATNIAGLTNAILIAYLPLVSDFAKKLNLPIPDPVDAKSLASTTWNNFPSCPICRFVFTNGYQFGAGFGHVLDFCAPHSFYRLQNVDQIPEYYGEVRITKSEAISLARNALTVLGYDLISVFADLEPNVTPPPTAQGHVIPVYRIMWHSPLETSSVDIAIDVEINADEKKIENMTLLGRCFYRPPPRIEPGPESEAPEYPVSKTELLRMLTNFAAAFDLPIGPASANQIALVRTLTPWKADIRLNNGFRFTYEAGDVRGFAAPDAVFTVDVTRPEPSIGHFLGKWNLTEKNAADIARNAAKRLGYNPNDFGLEREPIIAEPTKVEGYTVPRFLLRWIHNDSSSTVSLLDAEINADDGSIKSFYIFKRDWINH
jgi:hypothetical protein